MKNDRASTIIILGFVVLSSLVFATEGTFQGRIVDPPAKEPAAPGWIFVEGRRHLVRRVDVSKALIVPAPGAPSSQGQKCGPECLTVGQEVRITAVQDTAGEWRATRVEILAPAGGKDRVVLLEALQTDPWASPSTTLRISAFGLKLKTGRQPIPWLRSGSRLAAQ